MKLPGTTYWNALYEEIRKNDPKTGTLRFGLILKTLKLLDRLLTISPHAESDVSPFTERINSLLAKNKVDSEVRALLDLSFALHIELSVSISRR